MVADGGTVVIGGIIISSQRVDITQVPIVGSIPIIGNLFKRTNISITVAGAVVLPDAAHHTWIRHHRPRRILTSEASNIEETSVSSILFMTDSHSFMRRQRAESAKFGEL